MTTNSITHLEIKCHDGNRHFYYGSMAAIFDHWTSDDIGLNLRKLYDYRLSPQHPYENDKCIIRQGTIVRKTHKSRI
jgi:hypothetical protein